MHDGSNGLDHRRGPTRLEDVATHVDADGAVADSVVRQSQRVALFHFLSAGYHDGRRATGDDFLEAFAVIRLDDLRPQFRGDATRQTEIARIAGHFFSHGGDGQDGNPIALPVVAQSSEVGKRPPLIGGTDKDGNRHGCDVQTDGVLDGDGQILVGEILFQDARAAGHAKDDGDSGMWVHIATQNAASKHERVRMGEQRSDRLPWSFEPGGRPLEVSMIDRQHHASAGLRSNNRRQTILHSPVHVRSNTGDRRVAARSTAPRAQCAAAYSGRAGLATWSADGAKQGEGHRVDRLNEAGYNRSYRNRNDQACLAASTRESDRVSHPVEICESLGRLLRAGETVVVAVSGGPDSIALLHALVEANGRDSLGVRFHVAHLNHQLRGKESDADVTFVADVAARSCVPITIESRDVSTIARSAGLSVEAAGRQERYAFLHRVCLRTGAKAIALGHHADDNAETILHRVIRGTGLRGLTGIPESRSLFPESDIRVVRPLLHVNRAAILAYLEEKGVAYRTDSSNSATGPTRNRLRHEILPALESINPRVHDALLRLAEQAEWAAEHVDDVVARSFESFVMERRSDELVLDVEALRRRTRLIQAEVARRAILTFQLGERDVSFEHIRDCMELLDTVQGTKRLSLPRALHVEKRNHELTFSVTTDSPEMPNEKEVVLAIDGVTRIAEWGVEFACNVQEASGEELSAIKSGRERAGDVHSMGRQEWVDADAVHAPLVARHRRPGDRFTPLGAPGAKSIADFLTDAKVDHHERGRLVIVADRRGPMWLVGLRIDERVKLTASTRRVLRLTATPLEHG